jgi:thiamine-phosphate diphosphorylase
VTAWKSGLPRLLVLTDRNQSERRGRSLGDTVRRAVTAGAQAVLLREKDLPPIERASLGRELREAVPILLVASDTELAIDVGADGVHLAASDPWPDGIDHALVVGRSCHDEQSIRCVALDGASYATFSPVFATTSKPGYGPALGTGSLGAHPLPVYALGGVTPGRALPCLRAGAAGIAVMGAVMAADDPGQVVRHLLHEVGQPS